MAKSKRSSSSAHSEQLNIFSSPVAEESFSHTTQDIHGTLQEDPDALLIDSIGVNIQKSIVKLGKEQFERIVQGVLADDPAFEQYAVYKWDFLRYKKQIQQTHPSKPIVSSLPKKITVVPTDTKLRAMQTKQILTNTFKSLNVPDVRYYQEQVIYRPSGAHIARADFVSTLPESDEDLRSRAEREKHIRGPKVHHRAKEKAYYHASMQVLRDIIKTHTLSNAYVDQAEECIIYGQNKLPISTIIDMEEKVQIEHLCTRYQTIAQQEQSNGPLTQEIHPNYAFDGDPTIPAHKATLEDIAQALGWSTSSGNHDEWLAPKGEYPPDERWLGFYEQELATTLQTEEKETVEELPALSKEELDIIKRRCPGVFLSPEGKFDLVRMKVENDFNELMKIMEGIILKKYPYHHTALYPLLEGARRELGCWDKVQEYYAQEPVVEDLFTQLAPRGLHNFAFGFHEHPKYIFQKLLGAMDYIWSDNKANWVESRDSLRIKEWYRIQFKVENPALEKMICAVVSQSNFATTQRLLHMPFLVDRYEEYRKAKTFIHLPLKHITRAYLLAVDIPASARIYKTESTSSAGDKRGGGPNLSYCETPDQLIQLIAKHGAYSVQKHIEYGTNHTLLSSLAIPQQVKSFETIKKDLVGFLEDYLTLLSTKGYISPARKLLSSQEAVNHRSSDKEYRDILHERVDMLQAGLSLDWKHIDFGTWFQHEFTHDKAKESTLYKILEISDSYTKGPVLDFVRESSCLVPFLASLHSNAQQRDNLNHIYTKALLRQYIDDHSPKAKIKNYAAGVFMPSPADLVPASILEINKSLLSNTPLPVSINTTTKTINTQAEQDEKPEITITLQLMDDLRAYIHKVGGYKNVAVDYDKQHIIINKLTIPVANIIVDGEDEYLHNLERELDLAIGIDEECYEYEHQAEINEYIARSSKPKYSGDDDLPF